MSPFLHPDNLTFILRQMDILEWEILIFLLVEEKIKLIVGKNQKNLGFPINTHNTENSLIVEKDGNTAYFVSNKNGFGLEDIFVFGSNQLKAKEITDIELDILTKQSNEEIIFRNVTFESNSFIIDSSSYSELDQLVKYLIKNPELGN